MIEVILKELRELRKDLREPEQRIKCRSKYVRC